MNDDTQLTIHVENLDDSHCAKAWFPSYVDINLNSRDYTLLHSIKSHPHTKNPNSTLHSIHKVSAQRVSFIVDFCISSVANYLIPEVDWVCVRSWVCNLKICKLLVECRKSMLLFRRYDYFFTAVQAKTFIPSKYVSYVQVHPQSLSVFR